MVTDDASTMINPNGIFQIMHRTAKKLMDTCGVEPSMLHVFLVSACRTGAAYGRLCRKQRRPRRAFHNRPDPGSEVLLGD